MAEIGDIRLKCPIFFEWIIPDFYSRLKKHEGYSSPKFLFCNQNWRLGIYNNSDCCPEFMHLFLFGYPMKKHHISYDISVRNAYGREFVCIRDKSIYQGILLTIYRFPTSTKLRQDHSKTQLTGTWSISCVFRCEFHLEESLSVAEVGDSERLSRDMEDLFVNGKDSDVTLVVQGLKFPVHSLILGARSSVFQAMFSHDVVETTSGVVNIVDFDPDVFHDFLLYLYSAKVNTLSPRKAVGLYSAADKYDTQELKAICVEFMRDNLSVDMFCSIVSLAQQHQESSLLEAATKFFVENFQEVFETADWQEFLKENPTATNELLLNISRFNAPPKTKQRTRQR